MGLYCKAGLRTDRVTITLSQPCIADMFLIIIMTIIIINNNNNNKKNNDNNNNIETWEYPFISQ